jgi:putative ABC transport system permease protein
VPRRRRRSTRSAGGVATVRLLIHFHPTNIPRLEETTIDARVLLFAVGASAATVLLCGLFPAWSASRCDVNEVLKRSGSRSVRGAVGGLHRGSWSARWHLPFVLLAGSGLLIRSFLNLQAVDKGFRPSSTVSMNIRLDGRYNRPERQIAFFREVVQRTSALPGVDAAAAASHLPLGGGQSLSAIEVEGYPFDEKPSSNSATSLPAISPPWAFPCSKGGPSPTTMWPTGSR